MILKIKSNRHATQVTREQKENNMRSMILPKSQMAGMLFAFLADHIDKDYTVITSQNDLTDFLKVNQETVKRCIEILVDEKFIHIIESGDKNIFFINPDIAWHRDIRQLDFFHSKVYVDKTSEK